MFGRGRRAYGGGSDAPMPAHAGPGHPRRCHADAGAGSPRASHRSCGNCQVAVQRVRPPHTVRGARARRPAPRQRDAAARWAGWPHRLWADGGDPVRDASLVCTLLCRVRSQGYGGLGRNLARVGRRVSIWQARVPLEEGAATYAWPAQHDGRDHQAAREGGPAHSDQRHPGADAALCRSATCNVPGDHQYHGRPCCRVAATRSTYSRGGRA
mmetsp:Transcript_50358/g.148658  ORF Transcript_50358/g.148658 Transcript_50358/m.148658 type:complete len:212 (-) Transcript_50358:160-795(-)